ncbi:MAG: UDP-N-acetylmuramate:L-alanyl-gamma-D-glutamyl-meso-diaminopimelate ligase [Gammaproteobacteria bacterium]
MHLHILGICGTFMGGIALLARALGHQVSGSDANVYPPMSTQLAEAGIDLHEGYDYDPASYAPDLVVIGNALGRGNPAVEAVLNAGLAYTSGPQWLQEHVLQGRWVMAVAGTHGKTTTSAMLAHILEDAKLAPGFLVGGVPKNFGQSARLGETPFFVIEADEYDTAFFDKRSKFVHYRPRTLIVNNLEYDHADIFPDLAAIQRQFHHLIRTVPGNGLIVCPAQVPAVSEVLAQGCWTATETIDGDWRAEAEDAASQTFAVYFRDALQGTVRWNLTGQHNQANALAAIAAARHAGVPAKLAIEALGRFENVRRRLEVRGVVNGITVYDDFAHHPTAIALTLAGLRGKVGTERILAVMEPRSNTMRLGVHEQALPAAFADADRVFLYAPDDLGWDLDDVVARCPVTAQRSQSIDALVDSIAAEVQEGDHVVVMSNGAFGGIHQRLLGRFANA